MPKTLQVQQPMILLGTSLGSAIAVHFARDHPECVRALVMSGPQVYVVSSSILTGLDAERCIFPAGILSVCMHGQDRGFLYCSIHIATWMHSMCSMNV